MTKRIIPFMLVAACFALPASAEEPTVLEPVTVQAGEIVSAERNMETIDLDTEAEPVVSTVPDALETTPGLDVQRRSILTPKSSQVRIRGMEGKRFLILLDGSNDLTDELSELPEWKVNIGVKYQRQDGALAKATFRWVDERRVPFIGDPGAPFAGAGAPDGAPQGRDVSLITLDDFMTVDVLLQYPIWKGTRGKGFLTAGVENLLDEDYREEYDFPAPGRMFHIGAEVRF